MKLVRTRAFSRARTTIFSDKLRRIANHRAGNYIDLIRRLAIFHYASGSYFACRDCARGEGKRTVRGAVVIYGGVLVNFNARNDARGRLPGRLVCGNSGETARRWGRIAYASGCGESSEIHKHFGELGRATLDQL